jgi:ribosomal protein S18 acetylase RimI-like enzyme
MNALCWLCITVEKTMNIVRLDRTIAPLLSNLAPDVFDYAINPMSLAAFIDDARHVMYLAEEAGVVVGMASGVEYFHPDKPPQLWINEVGVAETHRRRRIGHALISALVDEAKSRGCKYVWVGTTKDNIAAQACFRSVAATGEPQEFLLYEWDFVE